MVNSLPWACLGGAELLSGVPACTLECVRNRYLILPASLHYMDPLESVETRSSSLLNCCANKVKMLLSCMGADKKALECYARQLIALGCLYWLIPWIAVLLKWPILQAAVVRAECMHALGCCLESTVVWCTITVMIDASQAHPTMHYRNTVDPH